jgi:hypothetical protein
MVFLYALMVITTFKRGVATMVHAACFYNTRSKLVCKVYTLIQLVIFTKVDLAYLRIWRVCTL